MNPATLLTRLNGAPLCLLPRAVDGLRQSFLQGDASDTPAAKKIVEMSEEEVQAWRIQRVLQRVGPVAVISMSGVIVKKVPAWALEWFWLCDLDDIENALQLALNDEKVTSILLAVDSPGGYVTGVPELADMVAETNKSKPVYAFSDSLNCSAAYYISSQAREIAVTSSSTIGSIGTYLVLAEWTKAYEEMGITINFFREGKYKAMGASFKELTDEERELIAAEIKEVNDGFLAAVTRARPKVPRESMEGQTFSGKKSIAAGLADGIVNNLDEVVTALLTA
jgi:Periplasmic serine proteases (ClpP class)